MRKTTFFIVALLLCSTLKSQVTTLAEQDFDAVTTWGYSLNPASYEVGGDIWAIRSTLTNINTLSGDFWGMQDLENPNGGGNFDHNVTFNTVTIPAGYTNVEITFDYDIFEYDAGDDFFYELIYDAVTQGKVIVVDGANGGGVSGEGTITLPIPNTVTEVGIMIGAHQNGGGDYGGFDNVKIVGTAPVMPVELVDFSANSKASINTLKWETAQEINNDYFEIQYSKDGRSFQTISRVEGNGTTDESMRYEYDHKDISSGMHYYQINQVDYDGTSTIYGPVSTRTASSESRFYPTATRGIVTFDGYEDGTQYALINSSGQLVRTGPIQAQLDFTDIPTGVYYITYGETTSKLVKF